jgi:quinolinate synthase
MFRIDTPHLALVIESLVEGRLVNVIKVPDSMARQARVALDRMLEIR